MFSSCSILHPTVIFRKNLFQTLNLYYDPEFKIGEDYEMWSRVPDHVLFANISGVLLHYRINKGQLTSKNESLDKVNFIVWKRMLEKLEINISEEEFELHKLLLKEKYQIDSYESLQKVNNWFDKIIENNDRKQIYDKKILLDMLSHKYYIAFKNIPEYKWKDLSGKYLNFKSRIRFLWKKIKKIKQ